MLWHLPVFARSDKHAPLKRRPEGMRRGVAGQFGDLVDGIRRSFQIFARFFDAGPFDEGADILIFLFFKKL